MNIQEFSNEFDNLARNYSIFKEYGISYEVWGFNEYEKSLFLTQAEEQYVLSLYNGKNTAGDKFEGTEETRRYLHNLIAEYYSTTPLERNTEGSIKTKNYLNKAYQEMKGNPFKSTLFSLPSDLWFITYESVQTVPDPEKKDRCNSGETGIIQDVIPVTQDEFHRIKRNPFKGPSYRRALRLDLSDVYGQSGGVVEIVSKYDIGSYYVRYIKKLEPIILVDLPEPLSINGKSEACECKLHEATHRDILELAVRLAIQSRQLEYTNRTKKTDNND